MQREDPDLTLEKVGKIVGLSKGQLSKLLSGKDRQTTRKAELDRFFGAPPEDTALGKRLLHVFVELDDMRKRLLIERANALLDEQTRTTN